MTANPTLVGPVSPTPAIVYEARLFACRVWLPDAALAHLPPAERRIVKLAGVGFSIKAPYGVAMNAASVLARACARWQITRFTFGPMSKRQLKKLDRTRLERYEDAFERLGREWAVNWNA